MIVFTVIGLLFFWAVCFLIGMGIGLYLEGRAAIDAFFDPVADEMAEIMTVVAHFKVINARGATS